MQAKMNQYKTDGKMAMKHMYIVILIFSVIQIIVSIAVAAKNSKSIGGYKSATFAAIWAMFLVIIFAILGGHIVFVGNANPVQVGFLIGVAAMLAQLFFVLMCIYFTLGSEATHNGYDTAMADKAYGAFAFFNMIIYFVWAIILSVHRDSVISHQKPTSQGGYVPEYGETSNPLNSPKHGGGEDYVDYDEDPHNSAVL